MSTSAADTDADRLYLGAGVVDLATETVQRGGEAIQLSPNEARLLAYLVQHAGRTISQAELLEQVWGYAEGVQTRTVYSTVTRLRGKVEADPSNPVHIIAVPRRGYRFELASPGPLGNLPDSELPLFGRLQEQAQLHELFDAGERLLTLVGPPGIGKTTLATAVARGRADSVRGGAWFCRLGQHVEAAEVALDLARALGAPLDESTDDPVAAVGGALAALGPALVLLDNCEESVSAVGPALARWLQQAPELQLLLTSRQPMGLPQEHCLRLEALAAAEAVQLFRTRSGQDAPIDALEHLVELIECIPLAIELAAGLVGLLGVDELTRRLEDSHAVLEARPVLRDGQPTTLARTIARSWDLLDADERAVLSACAVFRRSFDVPAAEAVAGPRALDCLARLVDKSLVVAEGPALHLLESVREFAMARLADPSGVRSAHALWCAQCLERGLARPIQAGALSELADRLEDLMGGFQWALEHDAALAVRIGLGLNALLEVKVSPGLRAQVLVRALDVADSDADRLRLLLQRSKLCRLLRQLDAASEALDQAEALVHSPADRAQVLHGRGAVALLRYSFEEALLHLHEAIDLATATGQPLLVADARMVVGDVHQLQGEVAAAREPLEQGLATFEAHQDGPRIANILPSLAKIEWESGHQERAFELLRRSIHLCDQAGNRRTESRAHMVLCWFLLCAGRTEEARLELTRSQAKLLLAPYRWSMLIPVLDGLLLAEEDRLHDAVATLRVAEARCREGGDSANLTITRLAIGLVRALLGDFDEARVTLRQTADQSSGWLQERAMLLDALVACAEGRAHELAWPEAQYPSNRPLTLLGRAHQRVGAERRSLLDLLESLPPAATPEVTLARRLLGL